MRLTAISLVFILILISSAQASAEIHHENYEDASTDMEFLRFFLDESLNELEHALNRTACRDADGAFGHLKNFTDLMERAVDTSSRISSEVDSFRELGQNILVLEGALENITLLLEGYKTAMGSISFMENVTEGSLDFTSIQEDLARMDTLYDSFLRGISDMKIGYEGIVTDLEALEDSGFDVIAHKAENSKIAYILDELSEVKITIEPVLDMINVHLMNRWGLSLFNLTKEEKPPLLLSLDIDTLKDALSTLSPILAVPISHSVERSSLADSLSFEFWSHQSSLLELLALLRGAFTGQDDIEVDEAYRSLQGSQDHLLAMRSITPEKWRIWESAKEYDGGNVEENLTRLEEKLDMYEEELDGLWSMLNGSFMSLSLDRSVIPYDSSMTFRIFITEKKENRTAAPLKFGVVNVTLDGMNHSSITIRDGSGTGELFVNRSMETGMHTVEVSYDGQDDTLFEARDFTVRKIGSSLGAFSNGSLVDLGEEVSIFLTLRNEFGKNIVAGVDHGTGNISVNGTAELKVAFDRWGTNILEITYMGDQYHMPDSAQLSFNVSRDPMITVSLDSDRIVIGESLHGEISLDHGSGEVKLFFDDSEIPMGSFPNGSVIPFEVDTSHLSAGRFTLQASLDTDVPWARDGRSSVMYIMIEEPTAEPESQQSDPYEEEGFELTLTTVLLAALTIVLVLVLFLAIRRMRKKVSRIIEDSPPINMEATPDHTEREASRVMPARKLFPGKKAKEAARYLGTRRADPHRSAIVATYLDLLDSCPDHMGIKRADTPREVCRKLGEVGGDQNAIDTILFLFEKAVYSGGKPTKEDVERFMENAEAVNSLVNSPGGGRA